MKKKRMLFCKKCRVAFEIEWDSEDDEYPDLIEPLCQNCLKEELKELSAEDWDKIIDEINERFLNNSE